MNYFDLPVKNMDPTDTKEKISAITQAILLAV